MDPISGVSEFFLSQGMLGVLCVLLGCVVYGLRKEMRADQAAHKIEIAAKDALINELQDERLKEAREGYAIAKSNQSTLDAFLTAVRGSRGHHD